MNIQQQHYLLHHNIQLPIRTSGYIRHKLQRVINNRLALAHIITIQQPHNLHPIHLYQRPKSINRHNRHKYTINKPFQPNTTPWTLWNINQHVPFLTSLQTSLTTIRETLTASPTLPYRKR